LRGENCEVTAVCCIYPIAAFLNADDLLRGWRLLETGAWKYAFSATTYASPIFRAFEHTSTGAVKMFFPELYVKNSQDLPEAWHDASQFYWGQPPAWLENARIYAEYSTVVPIPRWRVQDIDTPDDWIRAEMLAPTIARLGSRIQPEFS
jgi:N-acylneuraminate cytidylyltransferase